MTDREQFEAWKVRENPRYRSTDDSIQDRRDWLLWQAARAAPALHIDDAECVMHNALLAAHQRGPVTDDKVLLDELAKQGVVLARAAPAQPFPPENTYDPPRPQDANYRPAQPVVMGFDLASGPDMTAEWTPAQPAGERILLWRMTDPALPDATTWRQVSNKPHYRTDFGEYAWATIEPIVELSPESVARVVEATKELLRQSELTSDPPSADAHKPPSA